MVLKKDDCKEFGDMVFGKDDQNIAHAGFLIHMKLMGFVSMGDYK